MKKKLIIIYAMIVIVVMVILILSLILINKNNQKNNENTSAETLQTVDNQIYTHAEEVEEDTNTIIKEVQSINKIYNIEQCIRNYIKGVYETDSTNEMDYETLNKLHITNDDNTFYIKDAYNLEVSTKNTLYFVRGNLFSEDNIIEIVLTMVVDNENGTFIITPYGEKYRDVIEYKNDVLESEVNEQQMTKIDEDIDKNTYNVYLEQNVTDEKIAYKYYEDYKINALYNTQKAYEMLDEEYKGKRFGSLESYEKYMEKFKDNMVESVLSKYSIEETEECTEISLVDTHQNVYIIKITERPMYYTVMLDNYTIKVDDYEEKYNQLSNREKVQSNSYIFLQMINTKDYEHAYNLLDDTFKANNFDTIEKFEEYMQNNFFNYNLNTGDDTVGEQDDYYVYMTKIKSDSSRAAETKKLTIIMQLKEGTDFVMSFSIE